MASMRPRTRKDGSAFWEVLFRHDGRQRSLSFETAEHGQRFRDLVDLIGPAKALEAYDLTPTPRAANGSSMTVEEWIKHHIEHLTGCERKTLDEYRRFLKRDIAPGLGKIPLTALTPDHCRPPPERRSCQRRQHACPNPRSVRRVRAAQHGLPARGGVRPHLPS